MSDGDGYQLQLKGTVEGQVHLNSFHFRQMGEHSDPDEALFEEFNDNVLASYLGAFGDNYALDEIRVQKIWAVDPSEHQGSPHIHGVEVGNGTRDFFGNTPAAPWLCTLVRIRGVRGGRRWNSRIFLSNLNDADFAGPVILGGEGSALNATLNFAALVASRWVGAERIWTPMQLVNRSPKEQGAPHIDFNGQNPDNISTPVSGLSVSNVLTTNRSRRDRT